MVEKIYLRGIGSENIACFCCNEISVDGRSKFGNHNNSGFVADYATGMRVRGMFLVCGSNCFLDYRDFEPTWVQVKIGACDKHLPNLERLSHLLQDNEISTEKISAALTELENSNGPE